MPSRTSSLSSMTKTAASAVLVGTPIALPDMVDRMTHVRDSTYMARRCNSHLRDHRVCDRQYILQNLRQLN